MKIYNIKFQIISISLTLLFSVLINFTYGQEVNDTTTIGNNTIFEKTLSPTTVGHWQAASLYTKISPPILTSDSKQDGLFQLRLFDSKTENNITNVNYFLTISKAGKEPWSELFYSKEGPLTLKFQPNQGPITVYGGTEAFLGGWTSENGQITVSGPVLNEGPLYHFTVEIFGVDNVRNIFKPDSAPRFDSSFSMDLQDTEQPKPSSMLDSSPNGLQILSDNLFTDSVGYLHVVGEVQNNSPTNAQFVQVIGTFYDNNNQVVGTQFTYTNPSEIDAGGKAPFELILTSASIPLSQIDHYNLVATNQQ